MKFPQLIVSECKGRGARKPDTSLDRTMQLTKFIPVSERLSPRRWKGWTPFNLTKETQGFPAEPSTYVAGQTLESSFNQGTDSCGIRSQTGRKPTRNTGISALINHRRLWRPEANGDSFLTHYVPSIFCRTLVGLNIVTQ